MFGKNRQRPPEAAHHYDTLISEHTNVKGDIAFSGGLHVDGSISGNIVATQADQAVVRISEAGAVQGDVIAPHIIINGTVRGDVYASIHLELAEKASVTGSVYYNLIEMVRGAEVNGSLVHDREQAAARLEQYLQANPIASQGHDADTDTESPVRNVEMNLPG